MKENFTIPVGSNSYCGPAAFAYLTKTDPDTAAREMRIRSGRTAIKGVPNWLILSVLAGRGIRTIPVRPWSLYQWAGHGKYPTFKQWWLATEPDGLYLINITGHYIVLDRCRVYDNRYRTGKAFHVCPYLQRRVKAAWRIEQ